MGKDENPYAAPRAVSAKDVERPPRLWLAFLGVHVCIIGMLALIGFGNILLAVLMLLLATFIFADKFYEWRDYRKRKARAVMHNGYSSPRNRDNGGSEKADNATA